MGGQNDFRKALEDVESAERLMRDRNNANSTAEEGKGKKKDDSASGEGEIAVLDLALIKTDPDKLPCHLLCSQESAQGMGREPGRASR